MAAAALPNPLPFPAPEANPQPKQSPAFKPWQHKVLHLLSKGASVAKAMRCVGLTEDAFYKACTRHPEFKQHASAARELHIATVAETFHEAEAYARSYLDALLHDPEAPIALRLRVALAILNRKPGTWLPSPIPAIEAATEIPDTLDTLDIPDSTESPDILDKLDNAAAQATPDILDKLDRIETPDDEALLNELTACFGSRELAVTFYRLATHPGNCPEGAAGFRLSSPIR